MKTYDVGLNLVIKTEALHDEALVEEFFHECLPEVLDVIRQHLQKDEIVTPVEGTHDNLQVFVVERLEE